MLYETLTDTNLPLLCFEMQKNNSTLAFGLTPYAHKPCRWSAVPSHAHTHLAELASHAHCGHI